MSHFAVLVITQWSDWSERRERFVQEALAPFHEFECTGDDNEFVQEVDVTEDKRVAWAAEADGRPFAESLKREGWKLALEGEPLELKKRHKYGHVLVRRHVLPERAIAFDDAVAPPEELEVLRVIRRTNPNHKWDWWEVGGRWGGWLAQKGASERVDQLRKGELDLERMRRDAEQQASEQFDAFWAIAKDYPWPESLETIQAREPDRKLAFEAYQAQPMIVALHKVDHWVVPDIMGQDRAGYVARESAYPLAPFAVLVDGVWHEKGSMGWFGVSRDTMEDAAWGAQVQALLDATPDDRLLTIVDCHT